MSPTPALWCHLAGPDDHDRFTLHGANNTRITSLSRRELVELCAAAAEALARPMHPTDPPPASTSSPAHQPLDPTVLNGPDDLPLRADLTDNRDPLEAALTPNPNAQARNELIGVRVAHRRELTEGIEVVGRITAVLPIGHVCVRWGDRPTGPNIVTSHDPSELVRRPIAASNPEPPHPADVPAIVDALETLVTQPPTAFCTGYNCTNNGGIPRYVNTGVLRPNTQTIVDPMCRSCAALDGLTTIPLPNNETSRP